MIIVSGEALVDLFVAPPSDGGVATEAVAGGSPFNLAIGLARLGAPSAFLASISSDALGQFLVGKLEAAGVDTRWLVRSPNRTTLSLVATGADGHPSYAFYGEGGADRALAPADLPAELPDAVTCVAASSYALAVEPIATAIETLITREAGRRVISIDPNPRAPGGDPKAWLPRFHRLLASTTIVKASTEDLAALYGEGVDAAAIARDWAERGPRLIVVTDGPKGAIAWFKGEIITHPGRTVEVVDTVGAGDTFHAALLAWFDTRGRLTPEGIAAAAMDDVRAAMAYAIAASAITCARRGADMPTADDVAAALG